MFVVDIFVVVIVLVKVVFLWPCLLLLITLYLAVANNCYSEAPKGCDFVDIVVVVVVALLVATGHIILSCGQ